MEEWGIDGRPISEIIAEAERVKEQGEKRILPLDWLPGEFWGRTNEIATRDSIRAYANAVGDPNPLWKNPEYARQTIHGCIIGPPLYLNCIAAAWGGQIFSRINGKMALNHKATFTAFNAGSRWDRFKEVKEGDSFTVYDVFKGVELKKSHVPERVKSLNR